MNKLYSKRFRSHHDSYKALKNAFVLGVDKEEYLEKLLSIKQDNNNKVLYIHVPFCNKICSFCSFVKRNLQDRRNYHHLIIDQIKEYSHYPYMKSPINSVYFGGGTPTALKPHQLEQILQTLHQEFNLVEGCEISVETSCTELTDEMLTMLARNGVNRLSIGVQSFNDEIRTLLGRRGTGEFAYQKVLNAKKYIDNVGIDLIYNIPGETIEELQQDLEKIVKLQLSGISFYGLNLLEDTPILNDITTRQLQDMANLDLEFEQFSLIMETLEKHQYKLFELTKLIRDDLDRYDYIRVKHKLGECIPIGHSSGGNIGDYYLFNTIGGNKISDEIKISAKGRVLDYKYNILDMFIFDLQQLEVDLPKYSKLLHFDLEDVLKGDLDKLGNAGYISYDNGIVKLSRKGIFFGNNIIDELVSTIVKTVK